MERVQTKRGTEDVETLESGVQVRVLIEPSTKYLEDRQRDTDAVQTRERLRAQAVLDEIAMLETADLDQLRAYIVARAKERLNYDAARQLVEPVDDGTRR